MSSSIPSLEIMPDEILSNIVGNMIVQYSFEQERMFDRNPFNHIKSDLQHLSVCSKRLHDITTPFLFDTVSQAGRHSLPALIKRLLAVPQNGRFVKRIFADASVESPIDVTSFTEEEFDRCADIFHQTTNIDDMAEFKSGLKRGDWDPFIALLLCQTPCLEYIELLGQGRYPGHVFIEELFEKAARLQGSNDTSGCSLSHLSAASTYYHDTERGMGIYSIIPFVRLKSMEKVLANQVVVDQDDELDTTQIYHLKELNINGTFDGNRLVEFLPCFTSLERLKFRHGGAIMGDAEFLPRHWGEAISHLNTTLKSLELSSGGQIAAFTSEPRTEGLGPLIDFECLRELTIEFPILHGLIYDEYPIDADTDGSESEPQIWRLVDIFPKPLKRLTIYDCDDVFLEEMLEVLSQKEEVVPLLEFLEVHPDRKHAKIGRPLAKACETAGLEFLFFKLGSWDPESFGPGDSDDEQDETEGKGDQGGPNPNGGRGPLMASGQLIGIIMG